MTIGGCGVTGEAARQTVPMRRWPAAVLLVTLLAACGGDDGSGSGGASPDVSFGAGSGGTSPAIRNTPSGSPTADVAVRPESVNSPLPEVVVRQVQTGDYVQLKNLLPANKPLLVWFWAPH